MSRVRVNAKGQDASPVMVVLDLRNPNDLTLSTTRVELWLVLDGLTVGWLDRDSSVSLPKGTTTLALPLVPSHVATPARQRAFDAGSHQFTIEGRATFATPIGERKVPFLQTGEMSFGTPESPPSP
jgi:hypothetical protein